MSRHTKIFLIGFNKNLFCGTMIAVDCKAVETALDANTLQRSELDWLIYNKPLEYVQAVFSGEIEGYIKGPAEHRLID